MVTKKKKALKIQQGDVLFFKIDALPEGLTPKKDRVIVKGEQRSHFLLKGAAQLLAEEGGQLFVKVPTKATVFHGYTTTNQGDHEPVSLSKGFWKVVNVQEKGMFSDMVAPVVD